MQIANISSTIISLLLLFQKIVLCTKAEQDAQAEVAVYWGQDLISDKSKKSKQQTLLDLCESEPVDIVIITFLSDFNRLLQPTIMANNPFIILDFDQSDNQKENIAESIRKCQTEHNIKIFISLGGADGNYGFNNSEQAKTAAINFGKIFNNEKVRIDGLDLDIERMDNSGNSHFTEFVNTVRQSFDNVKEQTQERILISGAPECLLPSEYMDGILKNVRLDYLFIQFYNNECNLNNKKQFNWEEWKNALAEQYSINKQATMFLGLPGSHDAADDGYVGNWKSLQEAIIEIHKDDRFGGVSVWESSLAVNNIVKNEQGKKTNYLNFVKYVLNSVADGATTSWAPRRTKVPFVLYRLFLFSLFFYL